MSGKKQEECEVAGLNPKCPYISMITQSTKDSATACKDIAEIKKAIMGDLESSENSIVTRIKNIEEKLKRRWNLRDVGALFLGLAALLTALVAILKG
jgi:hypothetical protein